MKTSFTPADFSVGQELYWVCSDHRDGKNFFVKIEKVGRKYLELSNHRRVHVENLQEAVGYGSPDRCYPSKADHDAVVRDRNLWNHIRAFANPYSAPKGMTTEAMEKIVEIFKNCKE